MARPLFSRARRRGPVFAMATAGVVTAVVAVYLVQLPGTSAAAPARTLSVPSTDEAAAGVLAASASYPGGLPALLNLFDTGTCAGVQSYDSAPPPCRSTLDQIAGMGAGKPFPATLPDLGDNDPTIGPELSPDPSDQVTPESLAEMQADGAPPELISALGQNPPVVPPQYNTLPGYESGGAGFAGPHAVTTVPPTDPPTSPPPTTDPPTSPPTTTIPTTTDTTTVPTTTVPTTTVPTTTTTPTTTVPTTTTTLVTTTTTAAPPPPPPPLLVAVGDSITSGHEARAGARFWQPWRTTCDDPGTGAAAPGSSWAGNLRALIGVPWNRYFNYAHSGSSTGAVLTASPYRNPCGVVSQAARPQIGDATAVLAANPSRAGAANVAVVDAGVNNTNWTTVATQLVSRRMGGAIAGLFGAAPGWAVANPGACTDWAHGNPAGNATPGAPAGAIPPAWDGVARSAGIAAGAASISLRLIAADPGEQLRYLLYYRWIGDPNLPAVCGPAATRASTALNRWITFGMLVAQIVWAFMGGNPARMRTACAQLWNPGPNFIQTRLLSFGVANWALIPGYPHPNAAGRASLAACINATLPRAPGGGIA